MYYVVYVRVGQDASGKLEFAGPFVGGCKPTLEEARAQATVKVAEFPTFTVLTKVYESTPTFTLTEILETAALYYERQKRDITDSMSMYERSARRRRKT